jgi:hypothetical protein
MRRGIAGAALDCEWVMETLFGGTAPLLRPAVLGRMCRLNLLRPAVGLSMFTCECGVLLAALGQPLQPRSDAIEHVSICSRIDVVSGDE